MTQFEKALEKYPSGYVTLSKTIESYCPSDLLEFGIDDLDDDRNGWDREYTEQRV